MKSIFMINEKVNEFQWIGLPKQDIEIGLRLAKIRSNPVKDQFEPIKVEWLPETLGRELCDFPNFRSQFVCISDNAKYHLKPLIDKAGEFISLYGVEIGYSAFHCLTVYDAVDKELLIGMQANEESLSLASPGVVLPLLAEKIGQHHIFQVPEVRNKFFVSATFKTICEKNSLTGLSFHEVPVR